MTQYHVVFTGHIDERKRPENFPKTIKLMVQVEADTNEGMALGVSKSLFANFIQAHGTAVRLDDKPEELGKINMDDYTWVPLHMITHITVRVKAMTVSTVIYGGDRTNSEMLPSAEGEIRQ